jgi:TRAP-type transport system periplasmic protein
MKKNFYIMIIIMLIFTLLSVISIAQEAKTFKCVGQPEKGASHDAKLLFEKIVLERSKGMLVPEIYIDGQLGTNDEDLSTMISEGAIQLYWGQDMMSTWAEPILQSYTNVPFCFRDYDHLQAFWSSEMGDQTQKSVLEKYGVLIVTKNISINTPRHVTANKPIYGPEDLQGLKFRTPNIPGVIAGWEAAGANITPVQWGELFGALQTGMVDAQENPLYNIRQAGLYQVQKYIMLTAHQIQPDIPHINYNWWITLSEDEQNIILDALYETNQYRTEKLIEEEKEIMQELKDYGTIFIEHSEIDIQAFIDKITPAIKEKFDKDYPNGWEKIQSL